MNDVSSLITHAEDHVSTEQHGSEALISTALRGGRLAKGLSGSVTLAVDPSATPAPIGATSSAATVAGDG
jgi:hypothetical protein